MRLVEKIRSVFWRSLGGPKFVSRELSYSVFETAIGVVSGNYLKGDYYEFGVFEGQSFLHVYDLLKRYDNRDDNQVIQNLVAFDSFEGLPDSQEALKPTHYSEGQYSASKDKFLGNLTKAGVDLSRVKTVSGFFDVSLSHNTVTDDMGDVLVNPASLIYIDVDLEESCYPIFEFLTNKIVDGSIIIIDDFYRHRGIPKYGIQKAFFSWLEKNNIRVVPLHNIRRVAFILYRV